MNLSNFAVTNCGFFYLHLVFSPHTLKIIYFIDREPSEQVLEQDPLLVGFDIAKYVFTDISYGIPGTTGTCLVLHTIAVPE
jgi:hypothetical protein